MSDKTVQFRLHTNPDLTDRQTWLKSIKPGEKVVISVPQSIHPKYTDVVAVANEATEQAFLKAIHEGGAEYMLPHPGQPFEMPQVKGLKPPFILVHGGGWFDGDGYLIPSVSQFSLPVEGKVKLLPWTVERQETIERLAILDSLKEFRFGELSLDGLKGIVEIIRKEQGLA